MREWEGECSLLIMVSPQKKGWVPFLQRSPHSTVQPQSALLKKRAVVGYGHVSEIKMFSSAAWLPENQPRPWLTT